jgi:phosphate:Na+ symporter
VTEPNLIIFLLNIAGAAALLIWAVRLIQTGVKRGFASQFRQWLRLSSKSRFISIGLGFSTAIFLQSSTAVALLISNFAAQSSLSATAGLALLLGADVGSAVLTQLLLVRQPFLIPLCLLIGISLFLRQKKW